MNWDLPLSVCVDGEEHRIRNDCDYRVVLDVICALNDDELTDDEKMKCALFIFYEDVSSIKNYEEAIRGMFSVINCGDDEEPDVAGERKPKLMDWEHDFPQLAPPISRVVGYDIRTPGKYLHFWSFVGAYKEIGECTFSTVVSIRSKRASGKKLENWEESFYKEHKKMVDLPKKFTEEELEFLDSDW